MKMPQENGYYYNEHDENQVKKILKAKKRKKLKNRVKILIGLIVFVFIGAYFVSDYSKVQSIQIIGNEDIQSEDILNHISVHKGSIHLLVNTKKLSQEIKDIPLVKKASVTKDFFGHIKIEIEEADKIAYCVIDSKTYIIDELGDVVETEDKEVIESLHACPQLSNFKDLDFLKKFAKEYIKIPELIKNQTSDIIYSPLKSDETRLKFLMVNGKVFYLRVEDMADQLNRFDYEAFMTVYSDHCEFSFEGEHIYMKECPK